jgi:hypothetical protein
MLQATALKFRTGPRNCQLGVVVENLGRDAAKMCKRPNVAFEKGFRSFRRKCHYEAIVGVRHIEGKIVGRALLVFHLLLIPMASGQSFFRAVRMNPRRSILPVQTFGLL